MSNRSERLTRRFRELHALPRPFIIANPWDLGSALMLQALGFQALATSSAGHAFSRGVLDGQMEAEQMLAHCAELVTHCQVPISADLEKGFGDDPETVAETVRQAASVGLAGCSIEDASGDDARPIYEFQHALERVSAAVEAARGLGRDFVLTARAENYLHGRRDLDDTLRRLQAFEAAGADVLYAPGMRDIDEIERICSTLEKPVNVIMGISGVDLTLDQLAAAGVKRVSVGSGLMRLAFGRMLSAAQAMLDEGRFDFGSDCVSFARLNELLGAARQ